MINTKGDLIVRVQLLPYVPKLGLSGLFNHNRDVLLLTCTPYFSHSLTIVTAFYVLFHCFILRAAIGSILDSII